MSDGYSEEMLALILERSKILNRISVIESELDSHPPVPARLGEWIDSLQSINKKQFGLQDLTKITKLAKELYHLREEEQEKARKIRLYMIDSTLSELKKLEV